MGRAFYFTLTVKPKPTTLSLENSKGSNMRYTLFVVIAALMTVASASAQEGQKKKKNVPQTRKTVPVEDVSQRPDLTIPGVNWASRDLYIPVQNRGATA